MIFFLQKTQKNPLWLCFLRVLWVWIFVSTLENSPPENSPMENSASHVNFSHKRCAKNLHILGLGTLMGTGTVNGIFHKARQRYNFIFVVGCFYVKRGEHFGGWTFRGVKIPGWIMFGGETSWGETAGGWIIREVNRP